uniref:receptor-type tyrosine-protein phosphatase H isoform X4 n=1 Tax=Maylandia zebra TaxID=106582 RepID=UPI000D302C7E|nr:receptor-type tyrosine-protein phosphatase H isoform X4 [Maylandia zebra]
MKLLSLISDHLLLCVFLSLLWGTTDSNTTITSTVTTTVKAGQKSTAKTETSTRLRTNLLTAPDNVDRVDVTTQNENSITLTWNKVKNIPTYILQYGNIREDIIKTEEGPIVHVVTSLTAGTNYIFTLFTTSDGLNSSGYRFSAVTAPRNAEEFEAVGQNETSITLEWKTVPNIDKYILAFNEREINISNSENEYRVLNLTSGTRYNVTLFTVFGNVRSSGVNCIAVTAPQSVNNVTVVHQNETSITLEWKTVPNINNYILVFNEREINISNSEKEYRVLNLTSGTRYTFTLFTVFGNVRSSGVNCIAVTAPRNADDFKKNGQDETSITLEWKTVLNIDKYILAFNGSKINISNSEKEYRVSDLTSGTRYNFTLFTVFGNVRSSGVNCIAVTAPRNADDFKKNGQNETSITLEWKTVLNIDKYILAFNEREININNSEKEYRVSDLTSGTRYNFTLFTVFGNVRSSGVNCIAVTAPRNADDFKKNGQDETSITLGWKTVPNIDKYILAFNEREININNSEKEYRVLNLTSGTRYNFTLFTVFGNVRSSGVNCIAVTAPQSVNNVTVVHQNETSITLGWKTVPNINNYILVFNEREINISNSENEYRVLNLTSGTRYNVTLFTVFDNVRSSGVNCIAVTAPRNADDFKKNGQNETSITLEWKTVPNIDNYILAFNGSKFNISNSENEYRVLNLTSGTRYNFTLFTVFGNVRSSGVNCIAVTAPQSVNNVTVVHQNETSITLGWKTVPNINNYILVFNEREINISNSEKEYRVLNLTSGTRYNVTLFTVFGNVRSSGVNCIAVTAPRNADDFKKNGQDETSITLEWKTVPNIDNYILAFNGSKFNISNSENEYRVLNLTSGTRYNFTLFTVFDNVRSSGVNCIAVTAPQSVNNVTVVHQNETSITLGWKTVPNINNYILVFNEREINISNSENEYRVLNLTSGTRYNFTLFTVFGNVRSSGVNCIAVTAPRNADDFKKNGQDETSINLEWKTVPNIDKYILAFNGSKINISNSEKEYRVSDLTSGTRYNFTLFTVFRNVRSSGVNCIAVTAPRYADDFKKNGQNETSITLEWKTVPNIDKYILAFNEREINISNSEKEYRVSDLTSGTRYNFTLFTVFGNVRSSGVNCTAVTVPPVVPWISVTERFANSITLEWENMNKAWQYELQINGGVSDSVSNVSSDTIRKVVTSLQPGSQYDFSLTTVFAGLRSTPYTNFTVTAIDCGSADWKVTNSSIKAKIEGLFSTGSAYNGSNVHVSDGRENVSFTGLYPGATYNISLVYEKSSRVFLQCEHKLTILPPNLNAHCEYWAAGYSFVIKWTVPEGEWTNAEVNVTGKTHTVASPETEIIIDGFQPAKKYKVSVTSLSGVRSSEPHVFYCQTDPRGVIAGSVFGVLLFGLLVALVVLIFLKRPDIISRKKSSFIGGSKVPNTQSKSIPSAKFPDHFHQLSLDENRGFSEEYECLAPVGTDQTRKTAILPENKAKNRFNNVLPYDWCRVKLTTSDPDGISDYINANYMPGYSSNREYIATQGPLPSTVNDFWRMIWEQRVKRIVMVTNCIEGGRTKCEQYWPADSKSCLYGELLVTMRSEQQETNWTLREFNLKDRKTSEERTVKHFHFTAWPDHGVPECTEVLIQFRGLMRQHIEREGGKAPTVVHCSAGVGRTGTIISLDVLLQQLEKEQAVGINAFVHKMRLSRPYMVQTESQYVFLHQCIMDSLQPKDTNEENIYENTYENADMIYVNATALQELRRQNANA